MKPSMDCVADIIELRTEPEWELMQCTQIWHEIHHRPTGRLTSDRNAEPEGQGKDADGGQYLWGDHCTPKEIGRKDEE
jgi:hypothetical protein